MAGELVASAVVRELLKKLSSKLWSELGLLWNFKKDLEGMKTTLESIQAVLDDAEKQSLKNKSVILWLKRLKAVAYDIEDMLDHFQTQNQSKDTKVLKYFSSSKSSFLLPSMAHRLKGMRKILDNIAAERSKYNLREEAIPYQQQVIEGRNTSSAVIRDDVLGREEEATEIINRLLSASDASTAFSVIPIVGIGGLGKTTLAKLIFNDGRIKEVFEPRIWVHAMDFKLEILVDNVLSSLGTENSNILRNLEAKVERAKEILNSRRYLLVLDDVWNEDWEKWVAFKQILQGGQRESRIIVTTRSQRVSSIMGAAETSHVLKHLSDDICLELFEQRAFRSVDAKDNNLVSIGKEIVKKCKGVPLTANALGGMLHFTSGEAAWKKVRDSEVWELKEEEGGRQSENKIISSLKLSYQHMPSPLKLCFVYCSSYPKAFMLDKDMLIQQWIAQRFVQTEDEIEALEIGDGYVNHLLSMSFLEEEIVYHNYVETTPTVAYKMHDLVYDLARWVAGDEVSVLDVRERGKTNVVECRYASIIEYHQPLKLQKDLPQKVRALHFQKCSSLPKGIFSYTKCLRVLDLNNCSFGKLPTSVYELKQLRYLQLLHYHLEVDERIGKLWTLERLIISNSSYIRTLPTSIGKLHNLIYLYIFDCGNLSNIPDSIGSLQKLNNLKLSKCCNLGTLPESLGNIVNLKRLNINRCDNLGCLPESLGNLMNLETLNIKCCYSLRSLPKSLSNLVNLKILNINRCSNLGSLPESLGSLVNLETLNINCCYNLRTLPKSLSNLVNLKALNINKCDNLQSLPESLSNLMELRTLDIHGCAMLDELPKAISNMTQLKIQRDEPLKLFESDTDVLRLYLIDGPSSEHVVCHITDAKRINLKERGNIKLLIYKCGHNNGRAVEVMLEALQPHQNLQELCIESYDGSMFPSWMRNQMESFLPNLVKIELANISSCENLPMLGQLPKLEKIVFYHMPKVRRISEEFYGAKNTIGTSFPSLKALELKNMWELKEWVAPGVVGDRERGASLFPCLEDLTIYACPDLRVHPCIPLSLRRLELQLLALQFLTFLDVGEISLLKHLRIRDLEGMVSLPESIRNLTSLETLVLVEFKSLATLPEWLGELSLLRSLEINNIPLIDRLPQSIQHLTTMKSLLIKGCSENLLERTQKDIGEDWDKISHIDDIKITTDYDSDWEED